MNISLKKIAICTILLVVQTSFTKKTNSIDIEQPFFIQEFKKALSVIKKRCLKNPNNEICKILKKEIDINAIESNINIDGVVQVAQCLKKDNHVKTIAQKIETDPKKAKKCFKRGDKKSWKKFEQHLKKEVKKQAPIKCLWNKDERAKYEAAAFIVAVECSKSHQNDKKNQVEDLFHQK